MTAPKQPAGTVPCPLCVPIPNPTCNACRGSYWVTPEDARLINRVLRRH